MSFVLLGASLALCGQKAQTSLSVAPAYFASATCSEVTSRWSCFSLFSTLRLRVRARFQKSWMWSFCLDWPSAYFSCVTPLWKKVIGRKFYSSPVIVANFSCVSKGLACIWGIQTNDTYFLLLVVNNKIGKLKPCSYCTLCSLLKHPCLCSMWVNVGAALK